MKKFISIFQILFTEISVSIKTGILLYLKRKRLKKAISIAHTMQLLNRGRTYFVLEVDYAPGRYMVRSMREIKAGQKIGQFSKRARTMDFYKEAAYVTPTMSLDEHKQIVKDKEVNYSVYLAIFVLAGFLLFWVLMAVVK